MMRPADSVLACLAALGTGAYSATRSPEHWVAMCPVCLTRPGEKRTRSLVVADRGDHDQCDGECACRVALWCSRGCAEAAILDALAAAVHGCLQVPPHPLEELTAAMLRTEAQLRALDRLTALAPAEVSTIVDTPPVTERAAA